MLRSVGQSVSHRLLPSVWPSTWAVGAALRVRGRDATHLPSLVVPPIQMVTGVGSIRRISTGRVMRCVAVEEGEGEEGVEEEQRNIPPEKDRTRIVPVETSIKYMQSDAYKTTYGDEPVWVKFRRNFKGPFPPKKTRKTCVRAGMLTTGNACPMCRDEYLVLEYRNIALVKQFISPYSGAILPPLKTNICQRQHRRLKVAVAKARDCGLLTFEVPHRHYDYSDYYQPQQDSEK